MMAVDVHRIKDQPITSGAVKNIGVCQSPIRNGACAFRRHWREIHGPLASTIPSILRYEQNQTALECYFDGANPCFDGLAITWLESTASMRLGGATEANAATRADEAIFLPDGHLPIIIVREVLE